MTREEAKSCINTIELLRRLAFNVHGVMDVIDAQNCDKIIAMLSQEPCEDCISRQAVLDAIITLWADKPFGNPALTEIKECVERVPSVNPQSTGHWIEDTNGTYTDNHDTWECSQCGHVQILLEGTPKDNDYNYCPNCGCAMVEPQERSGEE